MRIRFDRWNFDRAIVYYKGKRMGEARLVDWGDFCCEGSPLQYLQPPFVFDGCGHIDSKEAAAC